VGLSLVTAALGVLLLSGFVSALSGPNASASTPSAVGGAPSAAAPLSSGGTLSTPIKHVLLIVMENEETNVIYGKQPYETALANTYAWGGNANTNPAHVGYYAVCHPSAPNYLALTSGKPLQCGSDSYNTYQVNNLGNELQQANLSWVDWEESATVPCQTYNNALYAVRHDPFTYYSDLQPNVTGGVCDTHVLPIANLTDDYPYNTTPPAFSYIVPNVDNDAHNTNATYGDDWLSTFVPKLIAAPWFSSSVIFITYDEGYKFNGNENFSGYGGLYGGPVFTVAVSPYTLGMGALTFNSSHYDLLSTMEWLLGLPGTGTGHDDTSAFPAITTWFKPKLFGPGVDLQYTHLPYANLAGYDLRGDNLQYANLTGADLQGADLRGAELQYADLAGANLAGADLRGALLQYADLAGASLRGADLAGASLQYADLGGAWLTGWATDRTDLDGAGLAQANLRGAVCGSPNYIVANGANTDAVDVPTACSPPL
jgi:phosphatidylinositol-3-phosphatase